MDGAVHLLNTLEKASTSFCFVTGRPLSFMRSKVSVWSIFWVTKNTGNCLAKRFHSNTVMYRNSVFSGNPLVSAVVG